MGIREKLNENPAITTGATIGIIVLALGFIGYQLLGGRNNSGILSKAYYTTDENATGDAAVSALFVDEADKIPPFDKDGKPAYLAHVFSCDGGKTKWVGHLQRFSADAQKKLEEAKVNTGSTDRATNPGMMEQLYMTGVEVKKPGPGPWVNQTNTQKASVITDVRCPDGTTNNIEAVLP